jgi:hypothetical protein
MRRTAEQAAKDTEELLTCEWPEMRRAIAGGAPLTCEQIERGLMDEDESVREVFRQRQAEYLAQAVQHTPVKKERKVI